MPETRVLVNFARFESQTEFLMEFLDDSAWFCLEKFKNQDFWSNSVRFGSRNGILTKFLNDSASFLLEKLKNHIILIKSLNI